MLETGKEKKKKLHSGQFLPLQAYISLTLFFEEIHIFIQQGYIELIKNDSNVTKDF